MSQSGDELSYRELIAGLLEDGEQFAKSRVKLYRAIVFYRIYQAKRSAILIGAGMLIATAAAVALLMAMVIALSQAVGPLWAGLIVGVGGLTCAGGLIFWGINTFPDLDEPLFDDDEFDVAPSIAARRALDRTETAEEMDGEIKA